MTVKRLNEYEELIVRLEGQTAEKQKEILLEALALFQPKMMLQDLLNPALRNAALYNAITALLKYHKIEVDPVAGARPDHPVGALAFGLPPVDFDDGSVKTH